MFTAESRYVDGELAFAATGARSTGRAVRERALGSARHVGEQLRNVPVGRRIVVAAARWLVAVEMRRLHDVLESTPMADRYWIWGGLLLGWAREGRVLAHDTADVDFAFRDTDFERMQASIPALEANGFHLIEAVRNAAGDLSVLKLKRSGIHFDFGKVTKVGERHRYYGRFSTTQVVGEIPAQPLVPFELFGRTWLKSEDHERELTAMYGDWRTPKEDWHAERDSPAIVSREYDCVDIDDVTNLSEHCQP